MESLKELEKRLTSENYSDTSAALLKGLNVPLERCRVTMSGLLSHLESGPAKEGAWPLFQKLVWPFQQQGMNEILANLEKSKLSLQLGLATLQLRLSTDQT